MVEIQKALDVYDPQKNNPFAVPDDVDLGFDFERIVNALDENKRKSLETEITNMYAILSKIKVVK